MLMHSLGYWVDPVAGIVYRTNGKPAESKCGRGYVRLKAMDGLDKVEMKVHRMVWETVNGPIPAHLEINHINGVKTDNRIENLELVTPSQNLKHAYRIGLKDARGSKNGRYIHGRYVGAK